MGSEAGRVVRRFEMAVARALQGPCRGADAAVAGVLVVAVSGGSDSLALLHALARLAHHRHTVGVEELRLHVAYFDHGLRPVEEVATEQAFVADQAQGLGLPFMSGRADVRAHARERGLSLEDAARRCRYGFLRQMATEVGAKAVAVGHTASDQAETVLLRILRGTGIEGLAAMDWRSSWPVGGSGPVLLRPLLGVWREETAAYCAALGLMPRQDPENESPRYLRNRVRRELLPLLQQYNPRVTEALCGLADDARTVAAVMRAEVERAWAALATVEAGVVRLPWRALNELAPAVCARVLRRACAQVHGDGLPPSRERLAAIERLLAPTATGRTVELAGGVRVTRERDELVVRREPVAMGGEGRSCVPGLQRMQQESSQNGSTLVDRIEQAC